MHNKATTSGSTTRGSFFSVDIMTEEFVIYWSPAPMYAFKQWNNVTKKIAVYFWHIFVHTCLCLILVMFDFNLSTGIQSYLTYVIYNMMQLIIWKQFWTKEYYVKSQSMVLFWFYSDFLIFYGKILTGFIYFMVERNLDNRWLCNKKPSCSHMFLSSNWHCFTSNLIKLQDIWFRKHRKNTLNW